MTAFLFPGGKSLVRSSASAAARRAHASVAAGLACLLLEKREAGEEIVNPQPRRLDALAQRLVLLLQVCDSVPHLGVGLGGGAAAPPGTLLQLPFRLDGARAPRGQLLRDMAKDGLELVEDLRISSL